jgi:methionyl aminopeptidase
MYLTMPVSIFIVNSFECNKIFFFILLENKAVGVMKAGHAFTIEPMISEGDWRDEHWPDGWTAVTYDGKRSAQFENTLLVTETGCEILTRPRMNDGKPWFMNKL